MLYHTITYWIIFTHCRDASSTAALIICGTIGESVFPVIIGWMIDIYGNGIFPSSMAVLTATMILCYCLTHIVGVGLLSNFLERREFVRRIYDWTGRKICDEHSKLLDDGISNVNYTPDLQSTESGKARKGI